MHSNLNFAISDREPGTLFGRRQCFTTSGEECSLPFSYQGTKYNKCTTNGDILDRPWCSTKVDGNGNHDGDYNWGYCKYTKDCLWKISKLPSALGLVFKSSNNPINLGHAITRFWYPWTLEFCHWFSFKNRPSWACPCNVHDWRLVYQWWFKMLWALLSEHLLHQRFNG